MSPGSRPRPSLSVPRHSAYPSEGTSLLRDQVEQFPVPIPLQEAIESLHEAGLTVGIGLGDGQRPSATAQGGWYDRKVPFRPVYTARKPPFFS